jgi:hypothetical protein
MATSVTNLPEGYTLEQPTTPQAAPPANAVGGLPEGYTLETDSTQAPTQTDAQAAYKKATAAGPFAPAGAAEKAMGQTIGDNKAQAKEGLKNLGAAALETAAGVTGATAATALIDGVPTTVPNVVDKAKAVVEWAKANPIKSVAISQIANELGVHPFDLMHAAVKYGKNLFGDSETDK